MRKILLIAAPITLAYLMMTWFLASFLGLTGMKLMLARILLGFVGILAAGAVVWFLHTKKKEEKPAAELAEPAGPGGDEVLAVLREAEKKLSSAELAKGAHIGNLPAILLLGEPSSTKTSTVLHCGLETESLAGQIYQDGNVSPTRSANLWFSRRTLFVEAGGKLMEDNAARTQLVKHLQPRKLGAVVGGGGQAPRAVLVCVEIERLTGGAQALATAARSLRAKLGEISQAFGIQLPVYALFTKTDRLPFFADFVRNLTTEEATQVFGATLPMAELAAGVYNEHQGARLGSAFDRLFHSLCDARPEFLSRENDAARLPGAYEFPREFSKLRVSLVQFLLDLCRPSQLTIGPFLRGFYFSGVRPVIVQETITAPEPRAQEKQSRETARDATGMFRLPSGGLSAAAPQPQRTVVPRKVPQWMFLTRLFNEVLLADRVAMGASVSSTKTSWWRRALLIFAAAVCLIFCIGFTVSFFQNRSLMNNIQEAQVGAAAAPAPPALASVASLRDLDRLRSALLTLKHPTLSYRWGLSVGDDEMYDAVYRIYFARFKTLLFNQTQSSLVTYLRGLPATPQGPPFQPSYDALKAYLMTTSDPDKTNRDFLTRVLFETWSGSQKVDAECTGLARAQFDFYADALKIANPLPANSVDIAVPNARRYLNQFGGAERIYHAMLDDASAKSKRIDFNGDNPGTKDYVTEPHIIEGSYTKAGWTFMQEAMKDPKKYFTGEPWVLKPPDSAGKDDPSKLIAELPARYQADFMNQWRAFLHDGGVVKYQNLKDASQKLTKLSGPDSPLLALLALASQNTSVDDDVVKKAFALVQLVVPPAAPALKGPSNQAYVEALIKLQTPVEHIADIPVSQITDDAAKPVLDAADAAKNEARALESRPDPDVQRLLEEPITYAQGLLKELGPGELNAKGKDFCGQFSPLFKKYPFNPKGPDATIAEVNAILRKDDGALWTFYDKSLKKLLAPQPDGSYAPVPGGALTLTNQFVQFFNNAATLSAALYANGAKEPHFSYSLKPVPTDSVKKVEVTIDGQTLEYSGGGGAPVVKTFTWQAAEPHGATGKFGTEGLSFANFTGLWSVFRFFGDATPGSSAAGSTTLDWRPESGNSRTRIKLNGVDVTVRFELKMDGVPPVFQKGFFNNIACVSEVAKQ